MKSLKFSIVTVVFNNQKSIQECADSVLKQTYENIEYVVVDGGSTDGTLEILRSYGNRISTLISEADSGLYDAMNKGMKAASGDFISFLNSDDFLAYPEAISDVSRALQESGAQLLYADLIMVDPITTSKTIRNWRSGLFTKAKMTFGWHPPHPTCFVDLKIIHRMNGFDLNFKIASDYDWMLRAFLVEKLSWVYLPRTIVKMRTGGKSNGSIGGVITANFECVKSWWKIGRFNPIVFFTKPLSKIPQLLAKLAKK